MFQKIKNSVIGIGWVFVFLLVGESGIFAQSTNSFTSLQQPAFAKILGLGGLNTSLYNNESGFFIYNPALVSKEGVNNMALSYSFLPGGAGLANLNYAFNIERIGVFGAAMQYLSFGSIQGYDNTGQPTTLFTPSDYTVLISHARQANNIRIGASLKFSNTGIDGFNGNAILVDLGAIFIHPERDFTVGLSMKNFGVVTSEFTPTSSSTLPFDMQLGTSFKPLHMPIRFSVTLYQLHQWDLMHEGEELQTFNDVLDNSFRHVVIGLELLLNDNLSILAGYNHLRRKELRLDQGGGFSGFSFGIDLNIKSFEFVYAMGGYHSSGNNHSITLAANLSEITTK